MQRIMSKHDFQAFYLMYHETNSTSNKLAFVGVLMYAIAFLLWNIDNNFCHRLKVSFLDCWNRLYFVCKELDFYVC